MSSTSRFADVAPDLVTTVSDGLPPSTTPPAGSAVALRTDNVDVSAAAGLRTVDTSTTSEATLTADTQHDLASVTKIVATTTALLGLVSAGVVGLDDQVTQFLPEFDEGEKAKVTLRHLLLHRGGLWEWQPVYLAVAEGGTANDFVDRLPLRYRPDSGRHYSDLGFMLLGRIVAHVTGSSLEQAVATLVTEPLGLTSTRFSHPTDDDVAMSSFDDRIEIAMIDGDDPYPLPYQSADFPRWRTEAVVGDVNDGNAFHAFDAVAGHAGLFSNVHDLIRFGEALARADEHEDLWRPDVVAEFFEPGPDEGQGIGFRRYRVVVDGESMEMLGHTGFVGCAVGFVPGRGIAVAMATNRLVTVGTPVPNDDLWARVRGAAGVALSERAGV